MRRRRGTHFGCQQFEWVLACGRHDAAAIRGPARSECRLAARAGRAAPAEPAAAHVRRAERGGVFLVDWEVAHLPAPGIRRAVRPDVRVGVDGRGLHRVSSGKGRTTCGYFYDHDRRIFYSSTEQKSPACPPRPDYSQGYVWALYDYDIYTANADGSGARRLTKGPGYNAEGTLSPDGTTIVFTSLRDGDLDIYTMRTDG